MLKINIPKLFKYLDLTHYIIHYLSEYIRQSDKFYIILYTSKPKVFKIIL